MRPSGGSRRSPRSDRWVRGSRPAPVLVPTRCPQSRARPPPRRSSIPARGRPRAARWRGRGFEDPGSRSSTRRRRSAAAGTRTGRCGGQLVARRFPTPARPSDRRARARSRNERESPVLAPPARWMPATTQRSARSLAYELPLPVAPRWRREKTQLLKFIVRLSRRECVQSLQLVDVRAVP